MGGRRVSRRRMLQYLGAGAAGVSLAGYTDTNDEANQESDVGRVRQDDEGGETDFHFVARQVFGTLDPAEQVDYTQAMAAQNLYDEFITVDEETFEPTANIADSWDTEDDGNTWVFTINNEVTFTDGSQLTAEDVVYSMRRMLRLERGYASFWLGLLEPENVEARDESTVAFTFEETYGPALATFVQFYILNSQVVEENAADDGDYGEHGDYGVDYLRENSAGSGAYVLEDWQEGDSIETTAYDDYWKGWPDNRFDRFRATVVTEESTVKATMRQGEADMTDQYMGTSAYEEMDSYPNVFVPEVPQLQLFHIPFNTQKEPTDDVNVRRAIALAFDYESAVNDIIGGGQVAAGPVPREMAGHNDNLEPMSQDLEAAQAALDESDYTVEEINEIGLEHVVVAGTELQRQMGLLNQSTLAELGIELEINENQWAQITDRATSEEETAHMTNIFHTAKMPSPDSHTFLMYHPSSFGSYISQSWYTTDEVTALLEEARKTLDLQERLDKYREVQELIVEGHPSIFVANPPYRIGINENVGGWQYRGVMAFDWNVQTMYREGDGRAK